MDDVYADKFSEEQYPHSLPGIDRLFWIEGEMKSTNVVSLISNTKTGLFKLYFVKQPDWNGHVSSSFSIERYPRPFTTIESSSYTFFFCTSNIVKIEKIDQTNVGNNNGKWDSDILGYWVVFLVRDKSDNSIKTRMMRFDKYTYIDFS